MAWAASEAASLPGLGLEGDLSAELCLAAGVCRTLVRSNLNVWGLNWCWLVLHAGIVAVIQKVINQMNNGFEKLKVNCWLLNISDDSSNVGLLPINFVIRKFVSLWRV